MNTMAHEKDSEIEALRHQIKALRYFNRILFQFAAMGGRPTGDQVRFLTLDTLDTMPSTVSDKERMYLRVESEEIAKAIDDVMAVGPDDPANA